jgi:hypothetical protein
MQYRLGRHWRTEFVFFGNPVGKIHNSKTGGRRTVVLTHDLGSSETSSPEFVDLLVQEWNQVRRRVATFILQRKLYLKNSNVNINF